MVSFLLFVALCRFFKNCGVAEINVQLGEAVKVKMKEGLRNHIEEGEDQELEIR